MTRRDFLVVVLLGAGPAWAYQLRQDTEGDIVRWKQRVVLTVDSGLGAALGEPRAQAAVRAAAREVDAAAPGLEVELAEGAALEVGYDQAHPSENRNVVVALLDWPWAATNVGGTLVTINRRTNEILDADVALNAEEWRFRVLPAGFGAADSARTHDVQNTLTHELGHALGLMHNDEDEAVVMYPTAPPGETRKRHLADDDRQGLLALYPQASPEDGPPPAAGCSSTSSGPGLALLAALAGLVLRRRRARLLPALALLLPGLALLLPGLALAADARGGDGAAAGAAPDRVVVGEVQQTRSSWLKGAAGLIVTDVEVRVVACAAPCEATVVVRVLGGRVGDLEQVLAHSPVPATGDAVVVSWRGGRTRLAPLRGPASLFGLQARPARAAPASR